MEHHFDFAGRLKGYSTSRESIGRPPRTAFDATEFDPIFILRRAILLRSLLQEQEHRTRNMNPIIGDKYRFDIDEAVLDAFLKVKKYHHGARSLESILAMSRLTDWDHFGVSSLPADSQLKLHVDDSFTAFLRAHTKSVG